MADRGSSFRPGRRPGLSLRFYFVALAVLIGLVAAAAGAYVYLQAAADAQNAATADAAFAAGKAAGQLNSSLKFIQQTMAPIASAPTTAQLLADPSKCVLGDAPVGPFETGHIDLVRSDGSVACTSLATRPSGAVYSGQPWLHTSASVVFAPMTDPVAGSVVAVVVYPIAGGGDMAWFFDLAPVGPKLAQEFGSGVEQLEFVVLSSDGKTVVARSIESARWVGMGVTGTRFGGAAITGDGADLDGTPRWYSHADGPAGWRVYVGADKAAALAAAAPLQQRQLGIIAVGVAAVLLATFLAYRQVARPIAALSSAVRESRGATARPPVPEEGPAEVAALGEDINQLISSLKREFTDRETAQRTYVRLFEASPLPMIVSDPGTGMILDANQSALDAFAYTAAEMRGLNARELYTPKDDQERAEVERIRTQPDATYLKYGPISFRKRDGSSLRATVASYKVDYAGKPAWVAMFDDVTEKEKLERQFQQTQRLESLGQLAGGVAHDFNNLLAVILNVTSQLKSTVETAVADDPDRWSGSQRDLERVEKAAQSAGRLTRQLLSFARREVVRGTVLSVSEQISGLTELLRRTLGSHVVLTTTLPEDIWPVIMDPGHLEQTVINLAVNSRDAMPKGGSLSITAANVTVDDAYARARPEISPGRYVQIQVADSGTGMDKATLDHVFEPFFTTKPVGQGTGLGLATVYGIVKQLRGHISLYSEPGHGTTATVLIPAADAALPAKVSAPAPTQREPASGTVLVVEDYADLRELIEEILRSSGYRVISAPDGAAGLELARAHAGEIDVLLTDIVMPNMLGPDLADQLRSDNPGLRVLFMSGHAQPALGTTTLAPGAVLLQKPFMQDELLDKLHEVLAAPAPRVG